jgi:UDP-GlcNAc:undecaprenyl-phosphate GlcNAc-1-phosphate transferase
VLDDVKDLGFVSKFAGQIFAALIPVLIGGVTIHSFGTLLPNGVLLPDWFSIPFTIIFIVGVTNATNLSDGLDGLAGGISLLIFICIGYFGYINANFTVVIFAYSVGGAIIGFLRFNSHPAQLFMGDAGSQLLGFLAAVLSLQLLQANSDLNVMLPLFLIGIPIVDTLTVMTKRLIQGKPPFVADKNHFHHQILSMGLHHSEAVLIIYIIQSIYILLAISLKNYNEWLLLFVYCVYSGSFLAVLAAAEKTQFRINRQRFLDPVKIRLQAIKEKGTVVKTAFGIVKIGVPGLFIVTCLFSIYRYDHYFIYAFCVLFLVLFSWFFKN